MHTEQGSNPNAYIVYTKSENTTTKSSAPSPLPNNSTAGTVSNGGMSRKTPPPTELQIPAAVTTLSITTL